MARLVNLSIIGVEGDPNQKQAQNDKAVTTEELKQMMGFEHWNESELKHFLDSIRIFTELAYGAWARQSLAESTTTQILPQSNPHQKAA